ncbi:glutaminyl-peptide cyclotransferase [Olleya sp. HaHaR_3_96]|uniref:glutaminyl-peptide cyclotransferase n=1 Tax=Olleya sp. HaHaR_3_96 TaxID=2745560 RepID=UPI001C4EE680|nr:glutaminyl-peptide cyclotransferase [Olleya sp. HaHaR_3_96]QXP58295.1 glutaminyl-peptide cyclotransferase [Olleya sp. HaHaR_3_96]
MKAFKYLTIIFLATALLSCGDNVELQKKSFSVSTNAKNGTISIDKTLELSLKNPKNIEITSVNYELNGKPITPNQVLSDFKLGEHTLKATINFNEETAIVNQTIALLSHVAPKFLTVEIINTFPHDKTSFTQGLEFSNGVLYESTGQYGESKIRIIDYKTGNSITETAIPDAFFGEGITVLNNTVYHLTWQGKKGFTYDATTLEKKSSFNYGQSKEGWGFANDGSKLYKSDGTSLIWSLNPDTLIEEDHIQVCTTKGKIGRLNEIEFANNKLYANIWEKNGIAIINPKNGAVEAVIDCTLLTKQIPNFSINENCLNGIAYNPETQTFFLTGKRWDKLFEVKIIEN